MKNIVFAALLAVSSVTALAAFFAPPPMSTEPADQPSTVCQVTITYHTRDPRMAEVAFNSDHPAALCNRFMDRVAIAAAAFELATGGKGWNK